MLTAKDLASKKNQLIEKIGVVLETQENLAPLAARIYATLLITGKEGITFDQLVKDLNASKSTVCTHLNFLQSNNWVSYFTLKGDRKRYFTIAPNCIAIVIDEMTTNWAKQKEIQEEIICYKKLASNSGSKESSPDLEFHEKYLTILSEMSHLLSKIKQNLILNHTNA